MDVTYQTIFMLEDGLARPDKMDPAILWVIFGGFLEPVWVIGLKKYNDTRNKLWAVVAIVFMFLSPCCLAFAMETMSVGVAYSIWTGIGAVMTLATGVVMYHDKLDRLKILFVFLIIAGVIGLEMSSEVVL